MLKGGPASIAARRESGKHYKATGPLPSVRRRPPSARAFGLPPTAYRLPPAAAVIVLVASSVLIAARGAPAQDLVATKEAVAVPTEIAEPLRPLLQPDAIVVMRGPNRLEFWWVKGVPLDTTPAAQPSWANVPDGNLYNKEGLPASPFRTDQ